MFSTIKQAVDYLVSKGIKQSFAKVAIDQQYNCVSGQPNLTWQERILCNCDCHEDTLQLQTTEEIMESYLFRFSEDGIAEVEEGIALTTYEQEPTYDINGD